MKANIVIEKDNHGYYAFCPEMKGCHTQGNTLYINYLLGLTVEVKGERNR